MISLRTRRQILERLISRLITHSDELTFFGRLSVTRALLAAVAAELEATGPALYVRLLAELGLLSSAEDALTRVARTFGRERKPAARGKVLVVFTPELVEVTAVTVNGGGLGIDTIELVDASLFAVTDTVVVVNDTAGISDSRTILSITASSGPNGSDELHVSSLAGSYSLPGDVVQAHLRAFIAPGTTVTTTDGATFSTLEGVYLGDTNPFLLGASSFVGLADKAWAEADEPGVAGNIELGAVNGYSPTVDGVAEVYNITPGTGGTEEETDYELKYRTAHALYTDSGETPAWLLAQLQAWGEVARVSPLASASPTSLEASVLSRSGASLSANALDEAEAYITARIRSGLTVTLSNLSLTAVDVVFTVTTADGYSDADVLRRVAARLAASLDWRRWPEGRPVDEADLITVVNTTEGVVSLDTSSFSPSSDVEVTHFPVLTSVTMTNGSTGATLGPVTLATSF